ncbi:hypothetical protein DACRYDRAFT_23009 [Dacryopinax primogenitus]|uniref:Uncharacterized protein n=1 Tax=Dacryopinax primogenitus (strain DJM 731) TaxID=1858805 RepID=M5G9Q2_DACPD|nr:uncharacterized protein DACRYDRAFT_23009 [Dacryopinax primogenitus]EJU00553.1 hypothetical protein DACRYDRAFT_23009 [Dacryopinax primogenitus]
MEGRRRFRWWAWIRFCSAVVVLLLAIWLGLEGAQRVGWEIQLDDVREYASMGWAVVYQCGTSGVDLLVQGARGGMEMLKQVAP